MKRSLQSRIFPGLLSAALLSAVALTACTERPSKEMPTVGNTLTEESETKALLEVEPEETLSVSETLKASADSNTLAADRIITSQSFDVTLNSWGDIRFVSYAPASDRVHDDVAFYLARNDEVLYEFPPVWDDGIVPWTFESVDMVSFQDIDGDGNEDVVALISYIPGAGPEAAVPFPVTRIYMGDGAGFSVNTELAEVVDANQANENIGSIMEFIRNRRADASGGKTPEETDSQKDEMYEMTGIKKEEARAFLETWVEHIKDGEKEEVSSVIAFPKKVILPNQEVIVQNAEEFAVYYDEIFTEAYKEDLYRFLEEDSVWWNYRGVALGDGEVWLNKRDGTLMIDALNSAEDRGVIDTEHTGVQPG